MERVSAGWRALTVEAVFPLATVGLLAVVSRALADVGVPVMVFSSHDTDHFLVPDEHLGRALAALSQARLERFLPEDVARSTARAGRRELAARQNLGRRWCVREGVTLWR